MDLSKIFYPLVFLKENRPFVKNPSFWWLPQSNVFVSICHDYRFYIMNNKSITLEQIHFSIATTNLSEGQVVNCQNYIISIFISGGVFSLRIPQLSWKNIWLQPNLFVSCLKPNCIRGNPLQGEGDPHGEGTASSFDSWTWTWREKPDIKVDLFSHCVELIKYINWEI